MENVFEISKENKIPKVVENQTVPKTKAPEEPSAPKKNWVDNMEEFIWDGPSDSDEEIPELVPMKAEFEKEMKIKFSKNGIRLFIEQLVKNENP